jgi:hypothetical protein
MDPHMSHLAPVPLPADLAASPALRPFSSILAIIGAALAVIGLATFAVLLFTGHEQDAWVAFLHGLILPSWISLGALFFLAIHHIVGAHWNTPIRRVMESLTAPLWLTVVGFIAIAAFGAPYLYEWVNLSGAQHGTLFHDHGHGFSKADWMQPSRWIATSSVALLAWIVLRHRLVGLSLRQDGGADVAAPLVKASVIGLIILAPTFTFFVWDLLMSLHVAFASTMWGVYNFTSAVQTFLAVTILAVLMLRRGALNGLVKRHTLHDLGTWLMVWSAFCGYIGFAQYLVIYFANMDEEVAFLLPRLQHGYGCAYTAETLIRVVLPLVFLMSQSLRAKPIALVAVSLAVLVGNWMDWSWIITPAFSPNVYVPFWAPSHVLIGLGFAGAGLLLVQRFLRVHGAVAVGDPRLRPTVNGEHL